MRPVDRHRATAHPSVLLGVEAVSLVSDRAFPRHFHDQFGVGVVDFGAHRSWSGRGAVEAGPGDVIMVNPGEIHDGAPVPDVLRGWRILYFDPDLVHRAIADDTQSDLEVFRPSVTDRTLSQSVIRLFSAITDAQTDPFFLEEAMLCLFGRIRERHAVRRSMRPLIAPDIVKVMARIAASPEEPVSLAELAVSAGLNRFQLLRGFQKAVGMTPYAYLLQQRILLAKRLLATGHTLAMCAAEAGFADQSHFTRAFTRQFGITPGRYRSAIR